MTAPPRQRLRRDRLTLTLYASFATWGWFLYASSPAVPLIADELGISRGLAGLHGTAMAAGTVTTGLISARFAERYGRRRQLVTGAGALVLGIVGILVGPSLLVTLPAVLVTAIGGNLTISASQPALLEHHGRAGPAALTEGNAVGAAVGLFAPLAVGASVGLGWGWRPAVGLAILMAVATALLLVPLGRRAVLARVGGPPALPSDAARAGADPATTATADLDDADARPAPARRGFTRTFWFFWVATLTGVAMEFSTVYWASDLLVQRTGAPVSLATAAVSALIAGMTVARFVVGPLSLTKAPEKLLLVGFATAGLGWAIFWSATVPWLAIVGLVVAGLGYGTHYPLGVALAMRASGGRPDAAQARTSVGTGAAVGVAPFLLGALADGFGAHTAFLLVPVLVLAGGSAVALGLRSVHRSAPALVRP